MTWAVGCSAEVALSGSVDAHRISGRAAAPEGVAGLYRWVGVGGFFFSFFLFFFVFFLCVASAWGAPDPWVPGCGSPGELGVRGSGVSGFPARPRGRAGGQRLRLGELGSLKQ